MIDYLNYGKQVQSIPKEPRSEIKLCLPPSPFGWLEYKLNQTELNHVWSCVNYKQNEWTQNLVGNIDSSFLLEDKNDWFFNNTLTPLINFYEQSFGNQSKRVPICSKGNNNYPPYVLHTWWVNYQKQHEFNPPHNHDGVYSFVIWLKIPYDVQEQNKNNASNAKLKGAFCFQFINILGEQCSSVYALSKGFEGYMLFFSSKLNHTVFPYYNCEEDRISVSGNILLKV